MKHLSLAADFLLERRLANSCGERLPANFRPSSLQEAWHIQQLISAKLVDHWGITVAGWKCGLPSEGKIVVAPIYANSIINAGTKPVICPLIPRHNLAAVEPEYAFVLKQHLVARAEPYIETEINAAIGHCHMALELIADRFNAPQELSFAELLADGLFNQGLLIGPQITATPEALLLKTQKSNNIAQQFLGQHPNRAPRAPLVWLVNFLRSNGVTLSAGQAIITGSLNGLWEFNFDVPITIEYGGLGHLAVEFKKRSSL